MKKKKSFKLPKHFAHFAKISGIELVDLKSVCLQIRPFADQAVVTCYIAGDMFCLSLFQGELQVQLYPNKKTSKSMTDFGEAVAAELAGVGWNPDTKRPQIAWKKKPSLKLARATDVVIAVLFATIHPYDPALIAPMLNPKKKKKKARA